MLRQGTEKSHELSAQSATIRDLTSVMANDLATSLVASGVTINSVSYKGADVSAGSFTFSGQDDVLGFAEGVVLSTGAVKDVTGPNEADDTTTTTDGGSDSDLAALVDGATVSDAAVLEIAFTPNSNRVFFEYVFASEEYNEFVNSEFN